MAPQTCKVIRSGNSAVVVLPSDWRKKSGVSVGDELVVTTNEDGTISFSKVVDNSEKIALLKNLRELSLNMPRIPWEDDSKEADRALLEARYV